MASLTADMKDVKAAVKGLDASVTDLIAGIWTPGGAQRLEHCARQSTVWLVCNHVVSGKRAMCSGAMVQHGTRSLVLSAGHCFCDGGSWHASSLGLHANGSLLPRSCSVLHNFHGPVYDSLDGMVLDCGSPEGLVVPLPLATSQPLTQQALVYTGFSNGAAAPDRRVSIAAFGTAAYLHTVFAHASASFADAGVDSLSGSLRLADGSAANLAPSAAFTIQPGLVPQGGMSGGPVLSKSCELVGVARGSGGRNNQGVYVPASVLLQRYESVSAQRHEQHL